VLADLLKVGPRLVAYNPRMTNLTNSPTFEFGDTDRSRQFFARHPEFINSLAKLIEVSNKVFGRPIAAKNRLEDVGFWLGHTCRSDFIEILFLCVNGYAGAATKLLRGLYERAVTLAYLERYPDKAERFVRYAAIQEHRAMVAALSVVSEEQFNEAMSAEYSTSKMRERHELIKKEFQTTDCQKCGTKRTQPSWDVDFATMVKRVNEPLSRLYLTCYAIPNLSVHATLSSAFQDEPPDGIQSGRKRTSDQDSEFALLSATIILFEVLRIQNRLFTLGLETAINESDGDMGLFWQRRWELSGSE
jgi:hypothetical protein